MGEGIWGEGWVSFSSNKVVELGWWMYIRVGWIQHYITHIVLSIYLSSSENMEIRDCLYNYSASVQW